MKKRFGYKDAEKEAHIKTINNLLYASQGEGPQKKQLMPATHQIYKVHT